MLRVVGVHDQDRLPATLALLDVVHLKGGRDDEDGQGQALRVDTGLDDLLAGAHGGALDEGQGDGHAGNPRGADDGVAVLAAPLQEALVGGLVLADELAGALAGVLVLGLGVLGLLEGGGEAVGVDDGAEGARGGDEEGAEGQREVRKGRVAARGEEDAAEAEGQAGGAADEAALEHGVVVRLLLLGGHDLHDGRLGGGGERARNYLFVGDNRRVSDAVEVVD